MKLATRISLLEPERAFTILKKSQDLEKKGRNIIHFEIGEPDFKTPQHITNHAINELNKGNTKYTPSLGIHKLRKELATKISLETNKKIDEDQIAITPGCKTAIFAALASVVNPGDEVIFPDPGFPAYKSLIQFFGGKPIALPLREVNGFSYEISELKKLINKKTKAIILNYPSNPTGAIIPDQDLEKISNLISSSGIFVLTDEIYSEILYTKKKYKSIYSLPNLHKQTIIISGFSKNYSMTGWRIGFLVFPKQFTKPMDLILNNMVSCTSSFTQEAAYHAIVSKTNHIKEMTIEYKKRRDYVVKYLNSIDRVTCITPEGAFYAFPNIKKFNKTSKFIASYLLNDAGVALLDGTAFGKYGEGYLRISYATDLKTIGVGLARIKKSLNKL